MANVPLGGGWCDTGITANMSWNATAQLLAVTSLATDIDGGDHRIRFEEPVGVDWRLFGRFIPTGANCDFPIVPDDAVVGTLQVRLRGPFTGSEVILESTDFT